ncbi:MAG TPA: hypothetical protein VNW47_00030 [Terriglobales bacterium]|nr:hypothetical protein [Terriglobales bacterium]
MKSTFALLTAAAFACSLALPAGAQQATPAPKLKRVQMKEAKEEHPEIAGAMVHLKEAKSNLEHASHDFAGHRAAALKHVNEALEECRLALESDKK